MAWITLAERPLRLPELLAGLALGASPYVLNDKTKQPESVLDLIKPLIDISSSGIVSFVHFTVKECVSSAADNDAMADMLSGTSSTTQAPAKVRSSVKLQAISI